jgi:triacylglycerol lipase
VDVSKFLLLRLGFLGVAMIVMSACAGPADVGADAVQAASAQRPMPRAQGRPTRYPIVLAHGFNASPGAPLSFYRVKEELEKNGHVVFEASVQPFASTTARAAELARTLDTALAHAEKVNIIAHSMGGLDARVAISNNGLQYGGRVASLTTIATPHRGTFAADVALMAVHGGALALRTDPAAAANALDALGTLYARPLTTPRLAESDLLGAFADLTEAGAPAFNERYPDDARVFYQSWAGVTGVPVLGTGNAKQVCGEDLEAAARDAFRRGLPPSSVARDLTPLQQWGLQASVPDDVYWLLSALSVIVGRGATALNELETSEPNDGLVTVKSAKWGHFSGCVPADHADLVGQPRLEEPDPATLFDHRTFYRSIAFDLASRGF